MIRSNILSSSVMAILPPSIALFYSFHCTKQCCKLLSVFLFRVFTTSFDFNCFKLVLFEAFLIIANKIKSHQIRRGELASWAVTHRFHVWVGRCPGDIGSFFAIFLANPVNVHNDILISRTFFHHGEFGIIQLSISVIISDSKTKNMITSASLKNYGQFKCCTKISAVNIHSKFLYSASEILFWAPSASHTLCLCSNFKCKIYQTLSLFDTRVSGF